MEGANGEEMKAIYKGSFLDGKKDGRGVVEN